MIMEQVALYARVSTPQQVEEATIESQIAAIEAYAVEQGYSLNPDYYYIDQAVSGGQLDRPQLNRLRDMATEGHFAMVLCLSPDRLARNYAHQWVLNDEFIRCGIQLRFVNQLGDSTTPEGQFLLGIQGIFAEYERIQIAERLRRGKLYRVRTGTLMSPVPPYGYKYLPVSHSDGGRWLADEIEAPVVEQMFRWYTQEGLTLHQIADRLNQAGDAMPSRGRRWRYSTVQGILKQRAYTGLTHYNRNRRLPETIGQPRKHGRGTLTTPRREPRSQDEWVEMQTPQLIDQEIWQQAQERMAMNQKFAARNNKRHFYLLRGLLVCDLCGRTLAGRTVNSCTTYSCTNRGKERNPDVPPHRRSIAGKLIEPLVWKAVTELLNNPTLIADAWQSQQEESSDLDEAERLESRLRKLERQWARLLDAFQDELLTKDELTQRKSSIDAQRQVLQERVTNLRHHQQQVQAKEQMMDDFALFCARIRTGLNDPTPEVQQEVIRLLIDHIVVSDDAIVIKHIIPTDDDCRLLPSHR
jgi:site-specific DNA recombinase